jgi:hypothetical protein
MITHWSSRARVRTPFLGTVDHQSIEDRENLDPLLISFMTGPVGYRSANSFLQLQILLGDRLTAHARRFAHSLQPNLKPGKGLKVIANMPAELYG